MVFEHSVRRAGEERRRSTAHPKLPIASTILGLSAIGAVVFLLQFSTPNICCNDYDGYYHIRWSQMLWDGLRSGDFPVAFTWLPLTALNPHRFADQQLLYHLLLAPFARGNDLTFGAKLATALFSSVAIASCFWLMLRYRIRYPLLWLLAMLGASAYFLQRLSFTRANSISLLLLVITTFLLFERKYPWLAVVAVLYAWTYNLFVLLWVAAICWTMTVFWSERRFSWRPLGWIAAGTAVGLLLNPYFPHDLSLFWLHLRMQTPRAVPAGAEWYPINSSYLIKGTIGALLAMPAGLVGFLRLRRDSRPDQERLRQSLHLLLFAGFLFVIALHSRRFTEYWSPFAILLAAFAFGPSLVPVAGTDAPPPQFRSPVIIYYAWIRAHISVVATAIIIAAVSIYSLVIHKPDLSPPTNVTTGEFAEAANWLRDNIPGGQMVFNINWGTFPKLYYYDSLHSYVTGLDPNYLYFQNADLGRVYERISLGEEPDPAPLIRNKFNAHYVFVEVYDSRTLRFLKNAEQSGKFSLLFRTKHCFILKTK